MLKCNNYLQIYSIFLHVSMRKNNKGSCDGEERIQGTFICFLIYLVVYKNGNKIALILLKKYENNKSWK